MKLIIFRLNAIDVYDKLMKYKRILRKEKHMNKKIYSSSIELKLKNDDNL